MLLMARHSGIFLLAFLLAASLAFAGQSALVFAQSCNASIGSSSLTSTQYYYNSYLGISTPVSAYCSFYAGQLYAVGDVFDTSANVDLGSRSTTLTLTYGGNTYTGQLSFSLPPSVIGHQLRLMVSVYGEQYGYYGNGNGQPLATAGQMLQVNVTSQNGYPNTNGNCYMNYNCYGNCYMNYNCYGNYQNANCYQNNSCYQYYCSQGSYCYSNYHPTCYENCYQYYCYQASYCYANYHPTCYYYDDGYYYQAYCNSYQHHDGH